MDEPFGALDPIIRAKAQDDLLDIRRRFGTTILLVTTTWMKPSVWVIASQS